MTSKSDFTEREWWRLSEAPLAIALYVAGADARTGPVGTIKELNAPFKLARRQLNSAGASGLLGELLLTWSNKLAADGEQVDAAPSESGESVNTADLDLLSFISEVGATLDAKGSTTEAQAVKDWLVSAAQRSAEAGKEGAVLGMGGEQVSSDELSAVAKVARALGASA